VAARFRLRYWKPMAGKKHRYGVQLEWTGNTGTGTASYDGYERAYVLRSGGKPAIIGSSDAAFRGDAARWNPEDLLVASLSSCHHLWYLHLCADAGVDVIAYRDDASGVMNENSDGSGEFTAVVLRPTVTISRSSDREKALSLHHDAARVCFVARSVNFPVGHEPTIIVQN
jgi:organic hydroperoxide reductase OsmC/OhrA